MASRKTVGYVVVNRYGPRFQFKLNGFYVLGGGGGKHRVATVFESREAAKTALIASREYDRHTGHLPADVDACHIVRLVAPGAAAGKETTKP